VLNNKRVSPRLGFPESHVLLSPPGYQIENRLTHWHILFYGALTGTRTLAVLLNHFARSSRVEISLSLTLLRLGMCWVESNGQVYEEIGKIGKLQPAAHHS